jgi:hypothetical protein
MMIVATVSSDENLKSYYYGMCERWIVWCRPLHAGDVADGKIAR